MKIKLIFLSILGLCSQVNFGMETPEISAENIAKAACKLVILFGDDKGHGFSSKSEKYKDNLVSILLYRDPEKKEGDSITFFVPKERYRNDLTVYTNMRGKEAVSKTEIPQKKIDAINEFINIVLEAHKQRIKQAPKITEMKRSLVIQQIKQAQNADDDELEADLIKQLDDLNEHLVFEVENLMLKWKAKSGPNDTTFIHGRITNINIDKYAPESLSNTRALTPKKSSTLQNIKALLTPKK